MFSACGPFWPCAMSNGPAQPAADTISAGAMPLFTRARQEEGRIDPSLR
ncbi:hypothetical protein EDD99_3481 [Streptomyces sp. 846.5]|nr:hypothetical protein EDD99_3481 [Streptomyces sp. 846.5]